VKVLFIGEGPHDVGAAPANPRDLRPARGTVCILARKVCPTIADESVALTWAAIARFNPKAKKRGFAAKIAGAVLIASRYGCAGCVFVTDRDRDDDRYAALEDGANRSAEQNPHQLIAFGLAIESIEAWTLRCRQRLRKCWASRKRKSGHTTREASVSKRFMKEAAKNTIVPSVCSKRLFPRKTWRTPWPSAKMLPKRRISLS
jgi:hypothetical protein